VPARVQYYKSRILWGFSHSPCGSSFYCALRKLTLHYTHRIASNSIVPELTCRDWVAHPPWGFWSSQLSKAWWWWRRKTCHELWILMPALVVECYLLPLSLGHAPLHPPCTSTLRCKPVHLAPGTVEWRPNPQRTAHLPLQTKHHKIKMAQSFWYAKRIIYLLYLCTNVYFSKRTVKEQTLIRYHPKKHLVTKLVYCKHIWIQAAIYIPPIHLYPQLH